MKKEEAGRRVAKVESEVQRVVANYILSHLQREVSGLLTVSHVQMPADLRTAKIFVSVLNSSESLKSVLEKLQEHAPQIQSEINNKLRMRYCPRISFYEDHTTDKLMKIEGILRELSANKPKE